jgi:flagellar assembly factor FliW
MQIETRRFGTIEIDDDAAFDVSTGIPGFPEMRHVALLGAGTVPGHTTPQDSEAAAESGDYSMYWLQDLDDGDLAFLCIVPWVAFPDYDFEIDERSLGIADEADIRVLSLVTARREDGAAHLTANLRAPLVVDTRARRLQQVILSDSRWPIRAPFAALTSERTADASQVS